MFPVVFAAVAGLIALSNFANARLVGRIGMRRLSQGALLALLGISLLWLALSLAGHMPLLLFVAIFASAMVPFAMLGSNFNALAMEPGGTGRHGFLRALLHADLSGRAARHADRPGLRRHGDAAGGELLPGFGGRAGSGAGR